MAKAVATLHAELVMSVDKYDAGSRKAAAITERTQRTISTGMARSGASVGMFGQRMQQAGYQVQDFAVQVAGGQGALRAFGQQAPQFLGVFGPAGAIAGAAISVGVLAAQFALAGSNTKGATKDLEKYAKTLERQVDLEKQLADLRRSPDQRENAIYGERAKLQAQLDALNDPSSRTVAIEKFDTRGNSIFQNVEIGLTEEQKTKINEIKEAIGELNVSIEKLEGPNRLGEVANELNAFFDSLDRSSASTEQGAKRILDEVAANNAAIKSTQERTAAQQAFSAQLDKDLAKVRDLVEVDQVAIQKEVAGIKASIDPLSDYRAELEKIERLRSRLTVGEYDAATGSVRGQMVDSELKAFFGDMDANGKLYQSTDKMSDAAKQMGFAFSSAFEDAVLEAGKLSDVLNGLVKDIARMAIRSAITAPLGNWVGGMFSGIFGGGKATGGPVSGGTTYMVGEKGPELFTPSGSGNITPNHKLSSAGGGDNIALTYNIGSGVTASQLMPILAMHKRDIIGTLADAKRRRTPMGAAMA